MWSAASVALGDGEKAPAPPSATGMYPAPVWSAASALKNAGEADEAPAPRRATGMYPGPVWGEAQSADAAPAEDAAASKAPSAVRGAGEAGTPTPAALPLSLKEHEYSEEADGAIIVRSSPPPTTTMLTNEIIFGIVREVSTAHSGSAAYAALSANREYQTQGHPSAGQRRFGLGFGLLLFTQESGRLGQVLKLMRQRDTARFAEIFGEHADELLKVTTSATAESRLQPVGGDALWSAAWQARFRRAGQVDAFIAAQNEAAIEGMFRPMLPVVMGLGLTTDRLLAMALDCVASQGLGGAMRWIAGSVTALTAPRIRQHALELLGHADLAACQRAMALPATGVMDAATCAAMTGALRADGRLALPTTGDLACRLVSAAAGTARRRLSRLQTSEVFIDQQFAAEQEQA